MRFFIQIVGGIIMLFTLSPELTLFMMIPMPIMICAGTIYGRLARRMQQKVQTQVQNKKTKNKKQKTKKTRFWLNFHRFSLLFLACVGKLGRTTETAEQTLSGIRFVRAFGQVKIEMRIYIIVRNPLNIIYKILLCILIIIIIIIKLNIYTNCIEKSQQEARESHEYGHEIDASFDLGRILALYSGIYQVFFFARSRIDIVFVFLSTQ